MPGLHSGQLDCSHLWSSWQQRPVPYQQRLCPSPRIPLWRPLWMSPHCPLHYQWCLWLSPDVSGFDFPITLPLAALRQSRLPIPSILFLLSYPHNGWIGQRFPSRAAALLQGQAYCTFARTGMAWVIECLRRSVQTGITSEWKFGAMLGMPESEFLTRALESSPSQDLEMRYTRASDFWVYPALDFGIWIDSVASNR